MTNVVQRDPRLALLEASYKEVLDATKHQDDKVGRLLTATAFLTAAALAMANLIGGRALPRSFSFSRQVLPALALLALGGFLLAVVFVVVLLVYSIATPLRIPGFSDSKKSGSRNASQIYFYSIADASRDEWKEKWSEKNSASLQDELVDMYVAETQNLAIRTDFKYSRMNEGVAVLSFALLAFGSAVVLALAASVVPCQVAVPTTSFCTEPAELSERYRYTLAAVVGAWVYITLLTQLRSGRLNVDQLVGLVRPDGKWLRWFRAWAGRVFALSASLVSALSVADPFRAVGGIHVGTVILFLLALALVAMSATYVRRRTGKSWTRWTAHVSFLAMGLGIVATGWLAWRGHQTGQYQYFLMGGYAMPVGVMISTLLGPTAQLAERRSKYLFFVVRRAA